MTLPLQFPPPSMLPYPYIRHAGRRRSLASALVCAALATPPCLAQTQNPATPASAASVATVAGVEVPTRLDTPMGPLHLNGAGLRRKLLAKVYVIGLYTPRKVGTLEAASDPRVPRRLHFIFQRDVSRREFSDVIIKAISSTSNQLEVAQASVGIAKLGEMVNAKKVLKVGDTLSIDWIPQQGTQILLNGKNEGEPIADPALNQALMRIFLGPRPIDAHLKNELLGLNPETSANGP